MQRHLGRERGAFPGGLLQGHPKKKNSGYCSSGKDWWDGWGGVGDFGSTSPSRASKELGLCGTSGGLPLPVGEVLSAQDKALKAMEMLREVLGEEVVAAVENLVQGNLPPKVPTHPPIFD